MLLEVRDGAQGVPSARAYIVMESHPHVNSIAHHLGMAGRSLGHEQSAIQVYGASGHVGGSV